MEKTIVTALILLTASIQAMDLSLSEIGESFSETIDEWHTDSSAEISYIDMTGAPTNRPSHQKVQLPVSMKQQYEKFFSYKEDRNGRIVLLLEDNEDSALDNEEETDLSEKEYALLRLVHYSIKSNRYGKLPSAKYQAYQGIAAHWPVPVRAVADMYIKEKTLYCSVV